jgi:8-oxo-dGTP diphosphatase
METEPTSRSERPVAVVGVVCLDGAGHVLLIRRGTPPRLGEWSIPGGRIEWGETAMAAARRELLEETGIEAEILGLVDVVDGLFTSRTSGETTRHYVMVDYVARATGGTLQAGDDAADAAWFALDALEPLGLWVETTRVIAQAAIMAQGLIAAGVDRPKG